MSRKTLIFVSSHRRHRKVADRIMGALAANRRVELLSFDRGSVEHSVYSDPNVSHTSLGSIKDGIAASRLFSLARATWILARTARRIRDPDTIVLANTFEMLLITWLCGLTRLPTIYDIADIHPLQLSRSVLGKVTRWLERRALARVKMLVVTSPWFYWEYYARRLRVPNAALLIENRVGFDPAHRASRQPLSSRIAWNGLLRCRASAMVLLECLSAAPSLHLALHGSLDRLGDTAPKLLALPNCLYTGAYNPESLVVLLSRASFVWGADFADGENSIWLLPNRLYDAIAAGIPLIVVAGTATAEVVLRHQIGIVLPECTPRALMQALDECTPEIYATWLTHMDGLRARSQRRNEWMQVLDDVQHWQAFRYLPPEIDVDVVLDEHVR
jgi:succinoglycan biosynthesis protein ExoL